MKVVIDMPLFSPLVEQLLDAVGVEAEFVEEPSEKPRALPAELIQDCEALFCTVPPSNHAMMKRLKLIQISSAGYNQLVGQGFEKRGIKACNALGVFDVPIAEWNISMMINLTRDLRELLHNQDAKIWDRSSRFQQEIRGSVVGILGYGGIGRETARIAKSMGMKVHVMSRSSISPRVNTYRVSGTGDEEGNLPDKVFNLDQKEDFFKGLDFLVLGIPQTASTVGIIGERELKMLPTHAYLLNPARGPLVQEQALLKALDEGWISGAALDTHYHYPMPANHPLWTMPNVILTPHISGSSASNRFLERTWDIFTQNIKRFQTENPLLNELTAQQLSG